MIDLIFLIAIIIIINSVAAPIGFVVFRYFIKRYHCYSDELGELKDHVKNNKLSESLFCQEKERLRHQYNVKFFEKWFGGR